jgi:hypothetical protein
MLAPALAVALTGHHYRSGTVAANIADSQRDGDHRLAILDAFGLVLQAPRMHQHRVAGLTD